MFSPIDGFLLPFRGIRLMLQPGVRPYVVVPLLLNLLIFALLAGLAVSYFDDFMGHYLPEDSWWSFLRPLVWLVFALAYAFTTFYTFTILANLIAAPFNGLLAAKVEQHLTGQAPSGSDVGLLASIAPAVLGELGKLLYLAKWMIPLLLAFVISSFIPGLNLLVSALWAAFGFWFLAIEYADYPMGNHDIKPREQRATLAARRLHSLGFGAGVSVLMLFLGFVAMPAAVAGATRFWVQDLQSANSRLAKK